MKNEMTDHITNEELVKMALEARENSYSPYSDFAVGAALLTKSGKVYLGANIENSSFSPTCCAERTAFFKAVFEGERNFEAIAVVGGKKGSTPTAVCTPCGVCRQVMREFCNDDFRVVVSDGETVTTIPLSSLLPYSFSKTNLE